MSSKINILVNGSKFAVELIFCCEEQVKFKLEDREYLVEFEKEVPQKDFLKASNLTNPINKTAVLQKEGLLQVFSPIPGLISSINVKSGQKVKAGDLLLQIEAMKMQNSIFAQAAGKIKNIFVNVGSEIKEGELLLEIEA